MADLARLIKLFEASEEASVTSRSESERARDYYDDKQLTDDELATLNKRKQPPVVDNLVKPKIDGLCGLERQTRTDPMCFPRTYGDDEAAQVATDALRYVADDQKLDIKRSQVFNHMLVEGYGGVEVIVKQVKGGIDPHICPIAWDRLFVDPHSSQADCSDAAYMGFINWMDADEAKAKPEWAGKEAIIDATVERPTSTFTDTYQDKPAWAAWADKRQRVRIVTMYYLEKGCWYRVVFTLAGELEPCAPSPWLDEDGKPECGLILQSAFVDRDNARYGLVRGMFSLQDSVNKLRSKYQHLINTRQMRFPRGSEANKTELKRDAAKPDAVFFYDKDEMEILSTADMAMGSLNLLQDARQSLQGIGPNAHMQGKEGKDQSGRAILAMQQAGMTEMAPLLDALRDFNLRTYRAVWNRLRQFWKAERWVRVTDDQKAVKFFAVNTTAATNKIVKSANAGEIDAATAQQYLQQSGQMAQMGMLPPELMQPANMLAELDVDIQIDEVMNTPTLQAEQFEQIVNLASSGVIQIPPELVIRASSLRDKQQLLDILEEQKQGAGQQQQQQLELQIRGIVAEIMAKEAEAQFTQAKTQGQIIENQIAPQKALLDAHQQGMNSGGAA